MTHIKNAPVALSKVIMEITSGCTGNDVPAWRVRSIVAKVLLITREIYANRTAALSDGAADRSFDLYIKDHLHALLRGTTDTDELLKELVTDDD